MEIQNLVLPLGILFTSLVVAVLSLLREKRVARQLKKIESYHQGKGRERLLERSEALAENQFKKMLSQLSVLLKDTTKKSLKENFDLISKDILLEKEKMLLKEKEEIGVYKQEEVKRISEAAKEAVSETARQMLSSGISKEIDEKYILRSLEKFLNETLRKTEI